MSLICRRCKRLNPPEAQYCYHDGVTLDSAGGRGPVAAGVLPFPTPFVMPSGHSCGSFDELVLACDTEWETGRSLLQKGFLEGFLGGLGRADLAMAARQAAAAPDLDRGLDELLAKLPSAVREPPKLRVDPLEIDLGEMISGTDQRLTMSVNNAGMGLLQGTVSCGATPWLAVGDAPAGPQKMFQCRQEMMLPVHVVGKALRANAKPLAGKLLVETNGGTIEIDVRVRVPIKPFPDGLLAGAKSPRQLAEKAKGAPKDAAILFASGAVAAWYEANGWTYPVQGPSATGLGAVQQFFEALGLVSAPKVTISTEQVQFLGEPGAYLEQVIQVQTIEKRPVYAHAVSKSAWMQIGKVQLKGQTAHIPLLIPSVPSMPGEELQSRVEVAANGNQSFTVHVALTISDKNGNGVRVPALPFSSAAAVPASAMLAAVPPLPPMLPAGPPPLLPSHMAQLPPLPPPAAVFDFQNAIGVEPAPGNVGVLNDTRRSPSSRSRGKLKHLVPLLILTLGLGGMLLHDYLLPAREEQTTDAVQLPELPIDPEPYIALHFHDKRDLGVSPALAKLLGNATMRFGLVMTREPIPNKPGEFKKLTFSKYGATNNTCLRIDGKEFLFGEVKAGQTRWVKQEEALGKGIDGQKSVWEVEPRKGERIVVTQSAEIVAGAPLPGESKRHLDTCLVRYEISNEGEQEHSVGIRFLLDTFIGLKDGVPFTIPGRPDLCDTKEEFDTPESVPDFIQVLENDDLQKPGTVARVQFRIGKQIEAPSRLFLGGWPDEAWEKLGNVKGAKGPLTRWTVPQLSMREKRFQKGTTTSILEKDSCVTMYWDERPLKPGEKRTVGFSYGLGSVASQESGGKLLLTVGGRMAVDAEFTLTALVSNPDPQGESLTFAVPTNLELIGGHEKESVPILEANATRKVSTVTWKIRAKRAGEYNLVVRSSKGVQQSVTIQVRPHGVFD